MVVGFISSERIELLLFDDKLEFEGVMPVLVEPFVAVRGTLLLNQAPDFFKN